MAAPRTASLATVLGCAGPMRKGSGPSALWRVLRRERVPALAGITAAVVVVGALGVLLFEAAAPEASIRGFGDALWYAVVTMTTVGYGDVAPVTGGGRVVGVVLM